MALSEKWVLEKARALLWNPDYTGFNPVAFTRAIEAEVRKQNTELIRNFVAAIKLDRHDWEDWPEDSRKAFEALRARLEGKPCA